MSIDYVNMVKLRGEVIEIREAWRGDKGAIFEVVLVVGQGERSDIYAVVSMSERMKDTKGFGEGAVVQVSAEMSAKLGKNGRWWGSCQAKKLEVVKEAAPKVVATSTLDDDEIPF